ncbi:diacylglycerol kinase [Candidatus Pelagibacter sp.]|nr:diacylglycerol kinase [Candidatus Pelagibacter sp.]
MIKKLYGNLINSLNGLKIVIKENSFILELIGGIFLILYLFITDISTLFKLLILSVYFLLLAFEIFNTSIEKLCDKITKETDKDIKIIKDLSSASVFVVLFILIILIISTFWINA